MRWVKHRPLRSLPTLSIKPPLSLSHRLLIVPYCLFYIVFGCIHTKHGRTPTTAVCAEGRNVHGNWLFVLTESTESVRTKHDPTRHVTDSTSWILHALGFPSVRVKGRIFPLVLIPILPLLKKKQEGGGTTKSWLLLSSFELLFMTSLAETTRTEISSRRHGET